MRKGYNLTAERRDRLTNHGYAGFSREGTHGDGGSEMYVREQKIGKPGLSVEHSLYDYAGSREACPKNGVNCGEEPTHHVSWRDPKGVPVATAYYSTRHATRSGKPMVGGFYADRSRGITHALAVGHIARHLDKVGVEPDNQLSYHSQRLVSHGFELKEQRRDSKLKDYLARREQRVRKGYKMSPSGSEEARKLVGGNHYQTSRDDRAFMSTDWLNSITTGKPGLTFHRHTTFSGARDSDWGNDARAVHSPGVHSLVYRDSKGVPVTMAQVRTHDTVSRKVPCPHGDMHSTECPLDAHDNHYRSADGDYHVRRRIGKKYDRPSVSLMASDRTRGAVHALGVAHVARALQHLGNPAAHEVTSDSERLIAHGTEDLGRTAKLIDYMKRRQSRVS